MRRYYTYIAAGAALAIGGLSVAHIAKVEKPQVTSEPSTAMTAPIVPAPSQVAGPTVASAPAELARPGASSELTELTTEIARLDAELAEREAEIGRLTRLSDARDRSIEDLRAELARRDAEVRELRDELAMLRERYAFEMQLAVFKSEDPAPIEAALEIGDAAALVAIAKSRPPSQVAEGSPLTEIHFETGSAMLTPGAQVRAAAAAVMLTDMTLSQIRLLGHTDRVGSPQRNRELAAARARTVEDFLVASGVPVDLIETSALGETDLPVATADGISEPLNRSVAIFVVSLPTS